METTWYNNKPAQRGTPTKSLRLAKEGINHTDSKETKGNSVEVAKLPQHRLEYLSTQALYE